MRYYSCIFMAFAILTCGCASMLRTEAPQPSFYRLNYEFRSTGSNDCFTGGVRIRNFTTSVPYDRTQMVVLGPDLEVVFSRNYQWIAFPGEMVAESIGRDLRKDEIFDRVAGMDDPSDVEMDLTGNIHIFACQRIDSRCRAVLNVEVNLSRAGVDREQLFHKTYQLQSHPFETENSALFAEAMSRIAKEFSESLRKDLCLAAGSTR